MPAYEYRCKACKQEFTQIQTLAEHVTAQPICPTCKSPDVEMVYGHVFVKTSPKP